MQTSAPVFSVVGLDLWRHSMMTICRLGFGVGLREVVRCKGNRINAGGRRPGCRDRWVGMDLFRGVGDAI